MKNIGTLINTRIFIREYLLEKKIRHNKEDVFIRV